MGHSDAKAEGETRAKPERRQTGKTYRNELGLPKRTPCQDSSANRAIGRNRCLVHGHPGRYLMRTYRNELPGLGQCKGQGCGAGACLCLVHGRPGLYLIRTYMVSCKGELSVVPNIVTELCASTASNSYYPAANSTVRHSNDLHRTHCIPLGTLHALDLWKS